MLTTVLVNFNHAAYLPHAFEALLNQTRPADELIVIDDVSTDNSVEIISRYLPRHPNARLIRNAANQGVVANMNDGLKYASGTVVHFAAADDVSYPALYERGMELLTVHPSAAFFSARSETIDGAGRNLNAPMPRANYPSGRAGYLAPLQVRTLLMREDAWFMGNTALFRCAPLIEEGGFPSDLLAFSDGYMCRLLALKYGVCFSPEFLGAWRRLEQAYSASTVRSPEKMAAILAAIERKMKSASAVFPTEYIKRCQGRLAFDAEVSALSRMRAQTSKAGTVNRIAGAIREKFWTAVLLLKLRPWDIPETIRKRLARF